MSNNQIRQFYSSLSDEEKSILCEALADELYFLDDSLNGIIMALLYEAEPDIGDTIRKINSFTMR